MPGIRWILLWPNEHSRADGQEDRGRSKSDHGTVRIVTYGNYMVTIDPENAFL